MFYIIYHYSVPFATHRWMTSHTSSFTHICILLPSKHYLKFPRAPYFIHGRRPRHSWTLPRRELNTGLITATNQQYNNRIIRPDILGLLPHTDDSRFVNDPCARGTTFWCLEGQFSKWIYWSAMEPNIWLTIWSWFILCIQLMFYILISS